MKTVKVSDETWQKLFNLRTKQKVRSVEQVIAGLLKGEFLEK